jgi:hypothetical protein
MHISTGFTSTVSSEGVATCELGVGVLNMRKVHEHCVTSWGGIGGQGLGPGEEIGNSSRLRVIRMRRRHPKGYGGA